MRRYREAPEVRGSEVERLEVAEVAAGIRFCLCQQGEERNVLPLLL